MLLFWGLFGYGSASYISYKYNQMSKAQTDLRKITDKKLFLL